MIISVGLLERSEELMDCDYGSMWENMKNRFLRRCHQSWGFLRFETSTPDFKFVFEVDLAVPFTATKEP